MCRLHPSLQCFLDVHDFRQVSRQICFAGFGFVYPSNDISVCSSCFQHKSTHTEGIVVEQPAVRDGLLIVQEPQALCWRVVIEQDVY